MRYTVEHLSKGKSDRFVIKNFLTQEGKQYIFQRCFDRQYTFKDSFRYTLISAVGFKQATNVDTLATREWSPYFLNETYNYDPSLILFNEGGVIKGNAVDIYMPNDGVVMGLSIVGSMILSIGLFEAPRPVKIGDFLAVSYNIEN